MRNSYVAQIRHDGHPLHIPVRALNLKDAYKKAKVIADFIFDNAASEWHGVFSVKEESEFKRLYPEIEILTGRTLTIQQEETV